MSTVMILGIVGVVALVCAAGLAGYWWGRAHLYDQAIHAYGETCNTAMDLIVKMMQPLIESFGISSDE